MNDPIRYVDGVPRWFTRLVHLISVRRCRKRGHVGMDPYIPIAVCQHCGQIRPPVA